MNEAYMCAKIMWKFLEINIIVRSYERRGVPNDRYLILCSTIYSDRHQNLAILTICETTSGFPSQRMSNMEIDICNEAIMACYLWILITPICGVICKADNVINRENNVKSHHHFNRIIFLQNKKGATYLAPNRVREWCPKQLNVWFVVCICQCSAEFKSTLYHILSLFLLKNAQML